jgi:hypothetical protein
MSNLFFVAIAAFFYTQSADAFNVNGCSNFINNGWYKKYEYQGFDNPGTKATKKHGSSKGTSIASTERTTATSDPKYSYNVTMSNVQYSSSFGPCSGLASSEIYKNRDNYYVQNRDEILREAAKGEGEHIRVLALFSLCEEHSIDDFATHLQARTALLQKTETAAGRVIDAMVMDVPELKKTCWAFGEPVDLAGI